MIHIRAIKTDWGQIILSKLVYLLLIGIIFIFLTSVLSYFLATIQYRFVDNDIITKFMINKYKVSFNIIQNVGISVLMSSIFIVISVLITTLLKKGLFL